MSSDLINFVSPIGSGTTLGLYTISAIALCVQPIYVLCCGVWCCMLYPVLHSHHNPYNPELILPWIEVCLHINTLVRKPTHH